MTETKKKLVLDWMRKIHQLEYAHRYQSIANVNADRWLGISAFVITTLVAFSYRFPSVEDDVFQKLPFFLKHDFFVPTASAVAAILTGILTFLKPSERSETHKKTSSNYEKLRHRIALLLTTELTDIEMNKPLTAIKQDWDSLDSINVHNRFFDRGKKEVQSKKKYPKELDFLDDVS